MDSVPLWDVLLLWPGDGEQWSIDKVKITGTGMESVLHTETWGISGGGSGGSFASGESKDITVPFHFSQPGMYKIKVDSWIEGYVDEDGASVPDEYPLDNDKDVNRETMFTVSFSDAEEEKIRQEKLARREAEKERIRQEQMAARRRALERE